MPDLRHAARLHHAGAGSGVCGAGVASLCVPPEPRRLAACSSWLLLMHAHGVHMSSHNMAQAGHLHLRQLLPVPTAPSTPHSSTGCT